MCVCVMVSRGRFDERPVAIEYVCMCVCDGF